MKELIRKIELALFVASAFMIAISTQTFADEFSGSTMKLLKTEGTVAVIDKNDASVSLFAGMKLNDGYSIATSKESYAWINLDDSKYVKLDALTNVTVSETGKNLVLSVNTGRCIIDVSKKLNSDETLNIKTGNVITGIRGTGVIVDAGNEAYSIAPNIVTIAIPDGTVVSKYSNGATTKSVLTTAGEKSVININAGKATTSEMTNADIPGFAALEIATNDSIRKRYEASSPNVVFDSEEAARLKLTQDILRQYYLLSQLAAEMNNVYSNLIADLMADYENNMADYENNMITKAINYKVGIRMDYLGQLSNGDYISGMNPHTGEAQYIWDPYASSGGVYNPSPEDDVASDGSGSSGSDSSPSPDGSSGDPDNPWGGMG